MNTETLLNSSTAPQNIPVPEDPGSVVLTGKKSKSSTKAQKIAAFKDTLASNKKAAIQALLTLNRLQTDSEKSLGVALKANGVGFSGYDAPILSSLALQISSRGSLTPKQMGVVHRMIPRYATQLLKLQGKI